MNATGTTNPLTRIMLPFQEFFRMEAAGGILLITATVIALIWANSPWSDAYASLWGTKITVDVGFIEVSKALLLWVNDGLMAIFFLLVGLEIKREILVGELSSWRQAVMPAVAAIGGMAGPAIIYTAFNLGGQHAGGWGVPMATDIAFAVGILALLGKRVPIGLKVFLVALAIVDDIGAVLVIAIFYTDKVSVDALLWAGGIMALLVLVNLLGVRTTVVYFVLGLALWLAVLKSGVHATIAGILLAFAIPAKTKYTGRDLTRKLQHAVDDLTGDDEHASIYDSQVRQSVLHHVEVAAERAQSPLLRLEHGLHPWVSFMIMPIFALANAGVAFGSGLLDAFTSRVTLGIIVGLVLGNQIGVTGLTWLLVKTGIGRLPDGVNMRMVYGAGCLAGIGFTMSLFIAALAFRDPAVLDQAKIGILTGSLIACIIGVIVLKTATRNVPIADE
jgi:NhaA family Na+:H+ antiporter